MNTAHHHSQNFLRSPRLVARLLSKTDIGSQDVVYDIGSGKGIITGLLAERCARVVSVEADLALLPKLRAAVGAYTNVDIRAADFLTLTLPSTPYKVFANIPFNMSAAIVRKLAEAPQPPLSAYLIVQKEFAHKLIVHAHSGPARRNSQMAIRLSVRFTARIVAPLRPEDFYPRPHVDAVLLEIKHLDPPRVPAADQQLFYDFIAYAFNAFNPSVQATLASLLSAAELSAALNSVEPLKPSQLSSQQWLQLFAAALTKRPRLSKLVGGYEQLHERRHATHTKLHRTRPH